MNRGNIDSQDDLEMGVMYGSSKDLEIEYENGSPSFTSAARQTRAMATTIRDWTRTTDMDSQDVASKWAMKQLEVVREERHSSNRSERAEPNVHTGDNTIEIQPQVTTVKHHFSERALAAEQQKWEEFDKFQFDMPQSTNWATIAQVRNYVFWVKENIPNYRRRTKGLGRDEFSLKSIRIHVGVQSLLAVLDLVEAKVDALIPQVSSYVIGSWEDKVPQDVVNKYYWLSEVLYQTNSRIEELEAIAQHIKVSQFEELGSEVGDELTSLPRAPPSGSIRDGAESQMLSVSRPPTPTRGISSTANTRGPGETSNSRSRYWAVSGERRPDPVDRRVQIIGGRGIVEVGNLSTLSSYKSTFATLGAIGFFGASISWGSVFAGSRGNIALLSWASALFVSGTVAAGGMAIIIDSGHINIDRDIHARRAVRALAVISGLSTLIGIALMSVTVILLEDTEGTLESGRKWRQASGIFTLAASGILLGVAIVVRIRYHHGPWRW